MPVVLLDAVGRRRSPATLPGFHCGRPPRNKGRRDPADPPTVEEIVAVMRQAGGGVDADRVRGLIVVLWRAGLRISEALDLLETDLDARRGSILVRRGKGGLGHIDLGIASVYLQGIGNSEIIYTVHSRRPPTISASVGLRL